MAVQRATIARSRVDHRHDIKEGSVVYVWRNRGKVRGWVGPGLAVCINYTQSSVWVSMRGIIVKCNIDRVRPATDEEWIGAELIKVLAADAKQHVERAGQRGYVDATGEEGPDVGDELPAPEVSLDTIGPLQPIPEEAELPSDEVVREPVEPDRGAAAVDLSNSTSTSSTSTSSSSSPPTPSRTRPSTPRPLGRNVRTRTTSSSVSEPASEPTVIPPPVEDDRTLAQAARDASSSASFAPQGGWIRAAERADRSGPYSGIALSHYICNMHVLPNTHTEWSNIYFQNQNPEPEKTKYFATADECCIALDENSNRLWVMLAAADSSSVDYRNLSANDKKLFSGSRKKELTNLFDLKAYRILSLEDSLKFREEFPECVLPSRWVDRWKATDEGGFIAKSRLVILGFKDPQVFQLERSSPTPTNEGFTTTLQICASRQMAHLVKRYQECVRTIKEDYPPKKTCRSSAAWYARGRIRFGPASSIALRDRGVRLDLRTKLVAPVAGSRL